MRTWFITSTTHGTWLPGDERGFVSNTPDEHDDWMRHNLPESPYDSNIPHQAALAKSLLKCPPIYLCQAQDDAILAQFCETCQYRGWKLHVSAVMANHFHAVLCADDAVESEDILHDLKSYASRRLNKSWSRPLSDTWWAESGSRRPVKNDAHLANVVRYVADQPCKLAFWIDPALQHLLDNRTE